ncbi:calcium-binding protein, partial [Neorhizobium galegae]|uniref:beta strand repeat-containing protein n=1 Tax=Neorhizobium galegae TaxID=399 RepID=UPI00203549BA
SGNDTLNGGAGADTLVGGSGDDTYVVDAAGDVVVELAGEGVDTVQTALATHTLAADVENLTFTGTTAAFAGTGNNLDNVIRGGAGADTLNGGAGNDTLTGGLGNDTYVVDSIGDVVVENAGEGIDTIRTTLSSYSIAAQTEIENLTFVGSGDFTGTGNAAANVLTGGAGNDILDGGAGIDTMVGGLGNDIFVVDVATDVVTEAASGGTDEIRTALASYSLAALANVENLTYTGAEGFTGTGNAAANTIRGASGNDTLNGGAGADTLVGGSGDDTYVVDAAGDVVVELAGEGVDTVQTALATHTLAADVENLTFTGTTAAFAGTGNSLDNVIRGGAGADTLDGGAGNDTLIGGVGIDRMIGGTGDDTLVVDVAGDIIVENAGEGTDTVQTALASYSLAALANVENLTYTGTAAFSGTGNSLDNVIRGGVAADTLDGMAGNDTLIGGLGNDTYAVDTTGDVVVENGGEGIDTVRTALSDYTLGANVENLTYTGTGAFAGTGNELDNVLAGGAGADTLAGGAGNDSYVVGAGDTVIENAGGGIDTVQTALSSYTLGANVENLTFTGTGAFTGTGNALDNIIRGGAGVDTLTGGVGNDTYVVTAGDIVVENAGEGTDTIETALATYTLGDHLEDLTFTGAVAFTGTGNALDNVITGGVAADRLTGGAGNDTLDGKAGTDAMIGGTGDDTYVVDNANDVVTENANEGTDEIRTSLAAYSLATRVNVENLDYTGTAAFTGTGNVSANVLRGGTGNDTLDGGAGADTLIGGLGNDIYVVDNVDDAIVEGVNEGTDTIRTALASFTLAANVENLTYTGTTVAFTGTGNILANLITGGSGADTLSGGGGDDTLNGGVGADTLIGDEGDDTYIIDNAGDVVTENANEGVDTVQTALATYSLATMANVENLTYTGTAAFTGTGNDRNNVIVGA